MLKDHLVHIGVSYIGGSFSGAEFSNCFFPPQVNPDSVECELQQFCLPFLRITSLLQHHLFGGDLPSCQVQIERSILKCFHLNARDEKLDFSGVFFMAYISHPKIFFLLCFTALLCSSISLP